MDAGGGLSTMNVNGLIALMSGLLSFFTPCILPLVPSYLIYISGITIGDTVQPSKKHRSRVFFHSLVFIFGFSCVFIAMGLSASMLGGFFGRYYTYIIKLGGIALIVLGLFYLDIIKISIFNRQYMMQFERKPLGFFGSFVVGITFSLGWTPCVGPALSSILIMSSMTGSPSRGAYLLSMYSLGLAIPFLASSLLFDRLFSLLKRYSFVARYSVRILGTLLIILGILLVTSYYNRLGLWIGMLIPSGT